MLSASSEHLASWSLYQWRKQLAITARCLLLAVLSFAVPIQGEREGSGYVPIKLTGDRERDFVRRKTHRVVARVFIVPIHFRTPTVSVTHYITFINLLAVSVTRLGNPRLAEAAARGVASSKAEADQFAANILPVIREIQPGGAKSANAIASAPNKSGMGTLRAIRLSH
jgi:hypothetical protein